MKSKYSNIYERKPEMSGAPLGTGYNSDYVNIQNNRRSSSLEHEAYNASFADKRRDALVRSSQKLPQYNPWREDATHMNESTTAGAFEGPASRQAPRRERSKSPTIAADGYTEYFSQGCDFNGQLGHGCDPARHDRGRQVNVPKSLSFDILIGEIACGAQHTLLLSRRGELFSIGSNEHGQLGLNDQSLEFSTAPLLVQEVQNLASCNIRQVACGAYHSSLVTMDGKMYAWGSNQRGQCGLPVSSSSAHVKKPAGPQTQQSSPTFPSPRGKNANVYTPTKISLNFDVESISLGFENTAALTTDGHLFIWGSNSSGQLGDGRSYECSHAPHELHVPMGTVRKFCVGFDYVLLEAGGAVYGVGANQYGQISAETKGDIAKP